MIIKLKMANIFVWISLWIFVVNASTRNNNTWIDEDGSACPHCCHCKFEPYSDFSLELTCEGAYNATLMNTFFLHHNNLKVLNYHSSELGTIPKELCHLEQLEHLHLNNDRITNLSDSVFECLPKLQTIDLDCNQIEEIRHYTFYGLSKLSRISMRYNALNHICPKAFLWKELVNLFELNFEHNNLTTAELWAISMPSFKHTSFGETSLHVNFSFNNIINITNSLNFKIDNLPKSTIKNSMVLDFRNNSLQNISNFNFPKLYNITEKNMWKILLLWNCAFWLTRNDWHCDCDMYHLITLLQPIINGFKNWRDLELMDFKCSWPVRAKGTLITKTAKTNFQCQIPTNCPGNCICWETPGNSTISVHCENVSMSNVPPTVPRNRNINLYFAVNHAITHIHNRPYFTNVSLLDLSSCSIHGFDKGVFRMLSNARQLKLDGNKITKLPPEFYETNYTAFPSISLYNNPIECNCETLFLKSWINDTIKNKTKNIILVNAEKIECSSFGVTPGKYVVDVPDKLLMCGLNIDKLLIIYFGMLLVGILNAIGIAILKRKLQMRVFFSLRKRLAFPRAVQNTCFHWDLCFICDESQLNAIRCISTTVNRTNPNLRIVNTIDHPRYGEPYLKGILDTIDQTQTSVLCISRELLLDKRAVDIFRFTWDSFIENKYKRIIVVLFGATCYKDIHGYIDDSDLKYFLRNYHMIAYNANTNDSFLEEFTRALEDIES